MCILTIGPFRSRARCVAKAAKFENDKMGGPGPERMGRQEQVETAIIRSGNSFALCSKPWSISATAMDQIPHIQQGLQLQNKPSLHEVTMFF